MASPLFGSAWTNAIMFATYERTLRVIDDNAQLPKLQSVFTAGKIPTCALQTVGAVWFHIKRCLLCVGVISGFCQTIAVTPTDLIKCRLQVQDGHASSHYNGPMDCIKHIYRRNGLRGLFLGYPVTLCREVPAFGFYFYAYELIKRRMMDDGVSHHTAMLTAGGLAGVGSWIIAYPADGKPVVLQSCLTASVSKPLDLPS
jgi:hypothetical protein